MRANGSIGNWKVHLLLISSLILPGCFGGQAHPDYFYRLDVPNPKTQLAPSPLQGTLQVTRPWTDALTSERNLVYRENNQTSQLHHHAYHRWVDSPTTLVQQEMARYLRKSHLATLVVTPEVRSKANYVLASRIVKLERVLDQTPNVVLELEMTVTHARDRKTLLQHTYRQEQSAKDNSVPASIQAYNLALSHILNRFITDAAHISDIQHATHPTPSPSTTSHPIQQPTHSRITPQPVPNTQ